MKWAVLCVTALPTLAWGQARGTFAEWVAPSAPPSGRVIWTVGFATGGFAKDPALAEAMRNEMAKALGALVSQGDIVRIAAFETRLLAEPRKVTVGPALDPVVATFPRTPAPDSRGGRDVERALASLAAGAEGPILLLSPGPSQTGGGTGTLMGEDSPELRSALAAFEPIRRGRFTIPTAGGPRTVEATVAVPKKAFAAGGDPRRPTALPEPERVVRASPVAVPVGRSDAPVWPYAVGGLVLGAAGTAVLRRLPKHSPPSDPVTPAPPTGRDGTELADWRAEAKRQQRALDLLTQDLAAAAEGVVRREGDETRSLRLSLAEREEALRRWDVIAMDYLDGIGRAVEDGVHPEVWARASEQFVRLARASGLDVIAPVPGEPVIDGHHRIESTSPASVGAPEGTVSELISHGFRRGDHVLRMARVVMAGRPIP